MSTPKHTKGPWEFCNIGDYNDFDGKCRVITGDNMRIAIVFADGNANMQAENAANAALIAAAPDLLEALHAVMADCADIESKACLSTAVGKIVRAAIAKAQ